MSTSVRIIRRSLPYTRLDVAIDNLYEGMLFNRQYVLARNVSREKGRVLRAYVFKLLEIYRKIRSRLKIANDARN